MIQSLYCALVLGLCLAGSHKGSEGRDAAPEDALGLSGDVLALVTRDLSIKDYVALLHTSTDMLRRARQSDYRERRLLAAAADSVAKLDYRHREQRIKRNDLLRSVRQLYRIRAGVLLASNSWSSRDDLYETCAECLDLSAAAGRNKEEWKINCFEALTHDDHLEREWPRLPEPFQRANILHVCAAATRQHNIRLLAQLVDWAGSQHRENLLERIIPEGVAATGDPALHVAVLDRLPECKTPAFKSHLLLKAAEMGQLRLLQTVMGLAPASAPATSTHQLMMSACAHGNLDVVEYVIKDHGYAHEDELSCMILAAEGGNLPIIKRFLWDGETSRPKYWHGYVVDPQESYVDIFHAALRNNYLDVVQFLMQRSPTGCPYWPSVTPLARGNEALVIAFVQGNLSAIEMLLHQPQHPNLRIGAYANRVLWETVKAGRLDMIEYMVDAIDKGDNRYRDVDFAFEGNLPLEEAVKHGHECIFHYFLRKKEEHHPSFQAINVADRENAVLITAAQEGQLATLKELLRPAEHGGGFHHPGVDPAAQDNAAILAAAAQGQLSVMHLLLTYHADRGNEQGVFPSVDPAARSNSPLHLASEHGYEKIVEALLQRRNGQPLYPTVQVSSRELEAAAKQGHHAVLQILAAHAPPALLHHDPPPSVSELLVDPIRCCQDPLVQAALQSNNLQTIRVVLHLKLAHVAKDAALEEIVQMLVANRHSQGPASHEPLVGPSSHAVADEATIVPSSATVASRSSLAVRCMSAVWLMMASTDTIEALAGKLVVAIVMIVLIRLCALASTTGE